MALVLVDHLHDLLLVVSFDDALLDPFAHIVGDAAVRPVLARVDRVPLVLEETRPGDQVAPDPGSALSDGDDVVVRLGKKVTVQTDGAQSDVWLTALDADEALDTLAERGGDVRLVASRAGARASLGRRVGAAAREPGAACRCRGANRSPRASMARTRAAVMPGSLRAWPALATICALAPEPGRQ